MPLILAVDTSAKPVSCALVENNKVLGCFYSNTGLTHSQTLMPMIDALLKVSDISIDRLDAVAVNAGPGSFTGVRIGVSAVKGIAFTYNTPCISVSTLEAMAYNLFGADCIALCVMDARCSQVYTAMFDCGEKITRLCEDKAVMIADLPEMIENAKKDIKKDVIILGDGAELCYNYLKTVCNGVSLAPVNVRYQRAAGVALAAEHIGELIEADALKPVYLRVPQAERELKKKRSENQ